jgi:hypothetical protein
MRSARQNLIAAFTSVGIVAPIAWFLMDRQPPYVFERVEIVPFNVPKGGKIEIIFTVKVLRSGCGAGTIYREFQEVKSRKLHTFVPVRRAEPPTIVDGKFSRKSDLPEDISSGATIYRGEACYPCNRLQNLLNWPVCSRTLGIMFNVVDKKEHGDDDR